MPRVRAGFATRFVALILAVLLTSASELCAQQADAPAPAEPKPGAAPDRSGTKKTRTAPRPKARRDRPGFYMGRPIADVMSWQGVDWLFRETRVDEEQPEAMLDALKIPPGATVADVGAGAGYHSVRLARRVGPGGTVLATDVQPEMIQMLKQNAQAAGVNNIKPLLCSSKNSMLPDGKVDLILMVDVYHECTDPETTLRGLRKAPASWRTAGTRRVSRRGPGGSHQARAQDDAQASSPRGRAPGFCLRDLARVPPLAAHHHLRQARRQGRNDHRPSPPPGVPGPVPSSPDELPIPGRSRLDRRAGLTTRRAS